MLGPVIVAEIGVGDARRQDQDVVIDRAVGQDDPFLGHVDGRGVGQHHADVRLMAEDPADRRGDVGRAERGGRHLVEQRLEEVVVGAVDDRDPARALAAARAPPPGRRSPTRRPRHEVIARSCSCRLP